MILYFTAASIGFLHTVFGPDHYLPFVMMGRARRWSLTKTGLITVICGMGHIISSIALGIIGIIFGIGVMKLKVLEGFRGNIAAWGLIGFGLAYFIWGLRRMLKNKPHRHFHIHEGQDIHSHNHVHTCGHVHVHDGKGKSDITPWILFTIFILGPCEPLIPILMYPAAKNNIMELIWVVVIFSAITIATMLGIVMITSFGINFVPLGRFERCSHALAGAAIFLCGTAIQFFGL